MRSKQQTGALVLLVDDHELVRRVTTSILEAAGYRTLAFGCGLEALAELEHRLSEIDIVISDVMMPTISGVGFVARLREAGYAGPVLYVTGYTGGPGLDVDDSERLLTKPFRARELCAQVERLLAEAGASSD